MRELATLLAFVVLLTGDLARGHDDDDDDSFVENVHDVGIMRENGEMDVQSDYNGMQDLKENFKSMEAKLKQVTSNLQLVTRQMMLQQFSSEEKLRSDGYSGVKQIRTGKGGLKSYFSSTHAGRSFLSMHDHANNIRTVGMGEFIAVLNGVEFRTRHNDYRLKKSHSTSKELHATEDIEFPEVPPNVLVQPTVHDQVVEMRKWFEAWKDSNKTERDYTNYFKPVLCYLEGAWMNQEGDAIDEPFESDRHHIDALGWFDLQEKVRYTSYSGSKSLLENLAYLPTTIMRIENGSIPVFAQWNYRILCNPVKKDIPLHMFRPDDEMASRMKSKRTFDEYSRSRDARFHLNTKWKKEFSEKEERYVVLDELMEDIPGKDNHQGYLNDDGFDASVTNLDGSDKDVSRYHRWFSLKEKDAMGDQISHRGYSDQYMFAARTTQEKVAGLKFQYCSGKKKNEKCHYKGDRWTYAIPLEIIYLTPLMKWNPYGIPYDDVVKEDAPGRNGKCEEDKAFTYTRSKMYYNTPSEFFRDEADPNKDNADTTGSGCFIGKDGKAHSLKASGTRIMLPAIEGIGSLRTRFPIAPVHREGSPIWKNYEAMKDVLMNPKTYDFMEFTKNFGGGGDGGGGGGTTDPNKEIKFAMSVSNHKQEAEHTHRFKILKKTYDLMKQEGMKYIVGITTEEGNTHTHRLNIRYNTKHKKFQYSQCDGNGKKLCWDKHGRWLIEED